MNAASIMDREHASLKAHHRIRSAAECIMERRYRSVPVTDNEGRFLGVFGVNCLLRLVLPKAAIMEDGLDCLCFLADTLADLHQRFREIENEPVSICMSTDVPVVRPDTSLMETLRMLYDNKMSLPVVEADSGKLVGMVTYWGVGKKILEA